MKKLTICILLFSIISIFFTGCGTNINEQNINENIPHYGQVTAVLNSEELSYIYDVKNNEMKKIGSSKEKIKELSVSDSGTIAQIIYMGAGKNLDSTHIIVYINGKELLLKNFFAASDIILNPAGKMLAYRSYNSDSLGSAQGLQIFDIDAKKTSKVSKKVMTSGNVYTWQGNDNIVYYGVEDGDNSYGKLYIFNVPQNKESIYFDGLQGYCTRILPVNNGIVYFENNNNDNAVLYYLDENKKKKKITSEISTIYAMAYNNLSDEIIAVGRSENEYKTTLYSISMSTHAVKRVVYDFPEIVDANTTLATDSNGYVYFTGRMNDKSTLESDVFSYDYRSKTISILSEQSGDYKLYGCIKNQMHL